MEKISGNRAMIAPKVFQEEKNFNESQKPSILSCGFWLPEEVGVRPEILAERSPGEGVG